PCWRSRAGCCSWSARCDPGRARPPGEDGRRPRGAAAVDDVRKVVMTRKTVTLLDYGSGNLHSAERALVRAGAEVTVTADAGTALASDGLVVPGVGAFAACMEGFRAIRGERIVGKRLAGGRPVLGICVGMQIMFERGVEF